MPFFYDDNSNEILSEKITIIKYILQVTNKYGYARPAAEIVLVYTVINILLAK